MKEDVARLREHIYNTLVQIQKFTDEPNPDWFNIHDYGSGFYMGNKAYATLFEDFMVEIIERLDQLKYKV